MKVIIFGARSVASQLWHYITHDSPDEVVGFAVDAAYREADTLHGLPLVDFETVETRFHPDDHAMIVSIGYADQNRRRERRANEALAKGYRLAKFVASRAIIQLEDLIGDNSVIQNGAIVQPFARVGAGVVVGPGSVIAHHATVEDYCYLAPNVTIGANVTLNSHCFVGVSASIIPGVTVAPSCFVAAGAVVVKDTEPGTMYVGVPARPRELPASFLGEGELSDRS